MPALKDPQHEMFARAVAQGKTNKEAAMIAGYTGKYVGNRGSKLAQDGNVRQRIAELNGKIEQQVVQNVTRAETAAITSRINRLATLQDLENRIKQVIAERAADPEMQNIPGGKSGLVFKQVKAIRILNGGGQELISEYPFDSSLAKELRAVGLQAQEEAGQSRAKPIDEQDQPVTAIQYKWVEPKIDAPQPVNGKQEREEVSFDGRVQ